MDEEDDDDEEEESPRSVCQIRTNPLRSEEKSFRASPISNGGAGGGNGDGDGLIMGVCLTGGVIEGCGGGGDVGDGVDSGTTNEELVGAPDQVT